MTTVASSADYVPFHERQGWQDLVPIAQLDAPNCLVPIAYSQQYRDAMDTFRAIINVNEKSNRTLEVTEALIKLNPGHYSIWAYRAQTLLAMNANLEHELDLMDKLVKAHIKSYQVWQHRKTIVTALQSSQRELSFSNRALSFDPKNYHTWAYRQWVLCHFFSDLKITKQQQEEPVATTSTAKQDFKDRERVWQQELDYVEELLQSDIRNNSAWNHRFFVCFESGQAGASSVVTPREIHYVKGKLAISPNNPSAWNYLKGVLERTQTPMSTLLPFVECLALGTPESMPKEEPQVSRLAELPAYLAIEFIADATAQQAKQQDSKDKAQEASALFTSLCQFDPIRSRYWQYKATEALSIVV
ncbi:CAAX geranylgeranyltransferase alpha subunit [Microbotryomycetes sp. JL221]|nr:CAAX geranylgeranyltransferase alpha subunit [Microbotryomycetes sp. JL221]